MAIEEAALLAASLCCEDTSLSLANRLKAYESQRAKRIRTLHQLSNWSQSIGHIDTPAIAKMRDKAAILINSSPPIQYLAEKVFDKLVDASAESAVFDVIR